MKGFLWGILFLIVANTIAASLGLGAMGTMYGSVMGIIYMVILDHFRSTPNRGSQIQIVKDGNTVHIQAGGDITVRSEIVDR